MSVTIALTKSIMPLSVLAAGAAPAAPATPARAVQLGTGGPELDACTSMGRVKPLNPRGDNFLSLRAAPNARAAERARLKPGAIVFICEQREGSAWLGVVVETPGKNCGTSSPLAHPRPYAGPCRSGWVADKFIEYIAG